MQRALPQMLKKIYTEFYRTKTHYIKSNFNDLSSQWTDEDSLNLRANKVELRLNFNQRGNKKSSRHPWCSFFCCFSHQSSTVCKTNVAEKYYHIQIPWN